MMSFTIPGNEMDIIVLSLGAALMILVMLAFNELGQLLKPKKKKRGPWDKK